MARSRSRPGAAVAVRTPPRIARAQIVDWRRDREVDRLTKQIVALQARGSTFVADTLVEIGARIETVRDRLPHGQWLEWVRASLPFEPRAAQRYIALSQWSRSEPAQFRRLRALGPSKLHLIEALPPAKRRNLQPNSTLAVAGKKKTIESMTVVELADALGLRNTAPTQTAIAKVVAAARHRTAALHALATELVQRKAEIDPGILQELRDEVAEVLAELDEGIG